MTPILQTFANGSAYGYRNFASAIPSDYESISTVSVGSGGSSTITFSSIPSTYQHLQVRLIARSALSGASEAIRLRFNGDTATSSYSDHLVFGDGASAQTDNDVQSVSGINVHRIPAATSTASVFGGIVIDLIDYANTNKYKTLRSLGGWDANGSGRIILNSGLWGNSGSAISSIDIVTSTGNNFVEYSQFALYGIKG